MKARNGIALFFILLLAVSIVLMQDTITRLKSEYESIESIAYLPQPDKIRPFLLGFSTTYSYYLWIRTTLYFGGHYITDQSYPWLVTMVDIVTRINPYFYPAYEFTGAVIPTYTNDPGPVVVILNRGIFHLGDRSYKLPFYLGWLYYSRYHDPATAATYLRLAAHRRDVPPYLPALTASMFLSAGQHEAAKSFLSAAYHAVENPLVRKVIADKIGSLESKP